MSLIALTEEDIPIGKPLPWNIVDGDGKVLFAQSKVVENRSLLKQLLKLGLFRSAPQDQGASETAVVSRLEQIQLTPGDLVQLQTMNNTNAERYQVRMIGFHAPVSLLVTAPTVQGKLVFIKEGQQFLVRGFVGKDAVAYKTRVLKSNLSPFPYLHLAYPDSVQSMRIRSSARVSVQLVTAIIRQDGSQGSARMTDISVGGARLVSAKPFANKEEELKLSFRINPSGLDVYLTLDARVRAVTPEEGAEPQVATGVEFIDLSEQDRLYLTNMVYQNLLKDNL
ncbi:flagellar brake protein [Halopseudomonas maritima]|uniref:flagellar brake protein n=1 Tax=Halopseudomonas maritima TaxID=2918528 RepID=UPI001EEC791C|nr:flagellar brake protein [Halopseudomonas maritima]UJJ33208.1 flagellar brake protein [Halopseudomonas maritima]